MMTNNTFVSRKLLSCSRNSLKSCTASWSFRCCSFARCISNSCILAWPSASMLSAFCNTSSTSCMLASISSCASRASLTASLAATRSLIAEDKKPSPLLPSMLSSSSWTTAFASAAFSLASAETLSSSFSIEESSSTTLSSRCANPLRGGCLDGEGTKSASDASGQLFDVSRCGLRCGLCGSRSSRASRPATRHLPASSHHSRICSPGMTFWALSERAKTLNFCSLLSALAKCLFNNSTLVVTVPMCSSRSCSSTLSCNLVLVLWTSSTMAATAESIILAPRTSMATGLGSTTASTLLR
mmetsp:Transcript_100277/g.279326  ORF Transcript_100277/g.279326 Transcript_100277/m.279326 type:complete len:299 (-) Transcript_100277:289-1185(-)